MFDIRYKYPPPSQCTTTELLHRIDMIRSEYLSKLAELRADYHKLLAPDIDEIISRYQ